MCLLYSTKQRIIHKTNELNTKVNQTGTSVFLIIFANQRTLEAVLFVFVFNSFRGLEIKLKVREGFAILST